MTQWNIFVRQSLLRIASHEKHMNCIKYSSLNKWNISRTTKLRHPLHWQNVQPWKKRTKQVRERFLKKFGFKQDAILRVLIANYRTVTPKDQCMKYLCSTKLLLMIAAVHRAPKIQHTGKSVWRATFYKRENIFSVSGEWEEPFRKLENLSKNEMSATLGAMTKLSTWLAELGFSCRQFLSVEWNQTTTLFER